LIALQEEAERAGRTFSRFSLLQVWNKLRACDNDEALLLRAWRWWLRNGAVLDTDGLPGFLVRFRYWLQMSGPPTSTERW